MCSIELPIITNLTPKASIAAVNAGNSIDTKGDTDTKASSCYHGFQEYQSKLLIPKNTKDTKFKRYNLVNTQGFQGYQSIPRIRRHTLDTKKYQKKTRIPKHTLYENFAFSPK